MKPTDRIFVALDTTDLDYAAALARDLAGLVGGVKLGKEFFTAFGPAGVERIAAQGMPVFLDLKYHDIPNTVAGAVRAARGLGVFMLNVHASGGRAMMQAAREALGEGPDRPLLIAVTVLTSMAAQDLAEVGVDTDVDAQVARLAGLAEDCGLDGVVCSAREIETLRAARGASFKLVTPGIRPDWAAKGDQKRIVTPRDAVARGADFLVIGRPITGAEDPCAAARRIAEEIGGA